METLARQNPSGAARPPGVVWIPQATVFLSSFCVMVVELVAGRIVSGQLGNSIYTWTSVIGIVLAGIAVGNTVGGRLADRVPAARALSVLFLLSSALCVSITVVGNLVAGWVFLWTLAWPVRVAAHVAVVFLLPSVMLGTISPVAAKMALDGGGKTGRTLGNVYAWGVVGSLVGTFLTGYMLIALLGVSTVIWGVAAILAALGLLFGAGSRAAWSWAIALGGLALLGTGPWSWARDAGSALALRTEPGSHVIYEDESQYSHIIIRRVDGPPIRHEMYLNGLLHSAMIPGVPFDHQYGYERIYSAATEALRGDRRRLHTLTIGGGGYVFPYYLDSVYPGSRTEVVEIDPAVTRAAVEAFGLPADHGLDIGHVDGRVHVRRLVEEASGGALNDPYDFLYLDAVDDFSVPYQLTTVEFLRDVEKILAPDGAFLMNLIDVYASGRFVGAMMNTVAEVFPFVTVLIEGDGPSASERARTTFILVGTREAPDFAHAVRTYDPRRQLHPLTAAELRVLRERSGGMVLTDDHAPVENLLAPVVRTSARSLAASALVHRAEEFIREGRTDRATAPCRKAVDMDPEHPDAHRILANLLAASGELREAVRHYGEAVRLHPTHPTARIGYAGALARTGRLNDAREQLERALESRPGEGHALEMLGVVQLELGAPAEAASAFRLALEVDPDRHEVRNNLGIALIRDGRVGEAVEEFRRVLRRNPGHAKARANLEKALATAPE